MTAEMQRRANALLGIGPAKAKPSKIIRVTDVKSAQKLSFEGVMAEIVEVNPINRNGQSTKYLIGYCIHDNRQNPPYVTQVAHTEVAPGADLRAHFKIIVDEYEKVKEPLWFREAAWKR